MHFTSSKSSLSLLVTDVCALLPTPLLPPPPICSVPLSSPSLAAAQLLPTLLHISHVQISPRKCLVFEVILDLLRGATTHYSNHTSSSLRECKERTPDHSPMLQGCPLP